MAIAFVQCAGNTSTGALSLSTTISAPGVGNQLVVCAVTDGLNANLTISSLTSQVWTKLGNPPTSDGAATSPDIAVWLSTNCGTGTTVTINITPSNPINMVVFEFSGTLGTAVTDGASISTTSPPTGTTVTPTSFTPSVANGVAVTSCGTDSSVSITGVSGGYTIPAAGVQGAGAERMQAGYLLLSGTPLVAPVWTTGSSNTQFANSFVVKPSGGSPAAGLPQTFDAIPFMSSGRI